MSWKKKITRIDRLLLVDCVPNPYALIVGVANAAFHVFWAVNGPECIDSAWDRVNKKGPPNPAAPGKRPRPHRRWVARGTTQGATINPPPGKLGGTLVPLGNLAQKIGFGMGLIDGVLEGIYYGGAMMMRYSGCRNPVAPYCELRRDDVVPALFPAQTFIFASWLVSSENFFEGDPGGVAVGGNPLQSISVGYHLTQDLNRFPPLPDCTFTSRLVWLPSGSPVRQNWAGLGTIGTGAGFIQVVDIFPSFTDSYIAVLVEKTEGVMFIKSASMTVVGGPIDSNMAAYDCGAKLGKL
jgi:hypothetical protein